MLETNEIHPTKRNMRIETDYTWKKGNSFQTYHFLEMMISNLSIHPISGRGCVQIFEARLNLRRETKSEPRRTSPSFWRCLQVVSPAAPLPANDNSPIFQEGFQYVPFWETNMAKWKSRYSVGNTSSNGPCSAAMLDYRGVVLVCRTWPGRIGAS